VSPREVMNEGAETVFSALDAMKRRAAADVLDHIADMGWVLASTTTSATLDPRLLARRLEEGHAPLVPEGDRGTLTSSPAPLLKKVPHDDDQSPE
jgi:hypothetical protein